MRLDGKVCLVTGGAGTIGFAIARELADRGANVHVCDLIDNTHWRDRMDDPARTRPRGGPIHYAQCDVSNFAAVQKWVDGVYVQAGRVDVLINNAAFIRWENAITLPVADAQTVMRVGFEGTLCCTHAVLPRMLSAGSGHIVNIGSIAGQILLVGDCAAYAASKAAIDAYSRTLQIDLANSGIKVTVMRLGPVGGTTLFRQLADAHSLPWIADLLPSISPDQVARGVVRALGGSADVITLPWHYRVCHGLFLLFPRLSRWMCNLRCASRGYG